MKELHITSDTLNQYASMVMTKHNQITKESDITPDIFAIFSSMFENDKSKNKTYISQSRKCIHIYYNYAGTEYMLTVPYNGLTSVDMIQYQVDVLYENEEIITITQQPGIPYLINSNDLGCKMLKAINHETGVFYEYKNNNIPHFCTEICDG